MGLKITLKPGERMIIGGAVITNGGQKSNFIVENKVPILRDKDILSNGSRLFCGSSHIGLDCRNGKFIYLAFRPPFFFFPSQQPPARPTGRPPHSTQPRSKYNKIPQKPVAPNGRRV